MGLDQFIYRMRRLTDSEISKIEGKNTNDIDDILESNVCIIESDAESDILLSGANKVFRSVSLLNDEVDWKALYKSHGIEGDVSWSGMRGGDNPGETLLYLRPIIDGELNYDEDPIKLIVTDTETHETFKIVNEHEYYVADNEGELYYWRKAWDIQEALADVVGDIENCGYYVLDKEALDLIREMDKEFDLSLDGLGEDEFLVYHPWW